MYTCICGDNDLEETDTIVVNAYRQWNKNLKMLRQTDRLSYETRSNL